jgi:hypothetical protein
VDWTNERYVRLYTRDTETVLLQPWQARHIFREMCRKCDRAGVIECRTGPRGLAVIMQMASDVETVATYMPHLLEDGSVVQIQDGYFLPNFMDANEAPQSDKQRAKESRNNRRDRAHAQEKLGISSRNETQRHETNENVTPRHNASLQPSPSSPSKPAVLRSAAATTPQELISFGAVDLTVAANYAIGELFGEQPLALKAGAKKSYNLAELVVNNDIPIDFAIRSVERQVKRLEEPVRTMWYFHKGILDDWGREKDAAVSAPRRFAQNDGVIPIRPQSSPVAPEDEGVVCKICRTKELHIVNGRQTPKHNEGCALGAAVKQIGN